MGQYHFDMDAYSEMNMDRLVAFIDALKVFQEKRQEIDNLAASLDQFLRETFAEMESEYDCQVMIDGTPWRNCRFSFKPFL